LGITPTSPSTGYGYIQRGEQVGIYQDLCAYKVLRFKEKPDVETAQIMLDSGDHDWNSGMFIWKSEKIASEIQMHMPELAEKLAEISAAWDSPARRETIERVWPTIHPETIDYGIMEKAERVAVLPASGLGWNDVGSWDSLFEVLQPDTDGNIILGSDVLSFDTHDSLVSANDDRRLIVTIGVKDLIVIDTGDALLVCDKDHAQQVRKVVGHLKENNRNQFL
jgi:mannose-1-phosphate guanylyltransferase